MSINRWMDKEDDVYVYIYVYVCVYIYIHKIHIYICICIYILEKEMATHSGVLAWRIPGTAEPGRLPSIGSHKVGHNWSDLAAAAAAAYIYTCIFTYIYIQCILLSNLKNDHLHQHGWIWRDIMLSEMSQRKKITVWYYLYVESIKHNSECNEKKKKIAGSQMERIC